MEQLVDAMGTTYQEILRKIYAICDVGLYSKAEKETYTEQTRYDLVLDWKWTILISLQNAVYGLPVVERKGSIASRLLTLFQNNTLGILLFLCVKVICSQLGLVLKDTVRCVCEIWLCIRWIPRLLVGHVNSRHAISLGNAFCEHFQHIFGTMKY